MKPRVVYWNNIPAPYMIERFDALASRDSLEFEAWFSARRSRGRSWAIHEHEWPFRYRYLPSVGNGEYPLAFPSPLFTERAPDVLVTLYAAPSFVVGSAVARRRGARVVHWVEPTQDAVVARRWWKDALKSRLFGAADGILTTGDDGRSFASRYGARPDRTFVVPHVVDFAYYASTRLTPRDRLHLRETLGVRGVTFLYVGRFLPGKGLGDLVDAFAELQRSVADEISLLLIGDGVHEQQLRQQCRKRQVRNVVFAGFRDKSELPKLYAAADVFVFPTLGDTFGMAVSEAMACGLPVIATSSSGEIRDRVEDGVNGFVVPPADPVALLRPMELLAGDAELRAGMGEVSRDRMSGQSPETWARAFEEAIASVLDLPRISRSSTDEVDISRT